MLNIAIFIFDDVETLDFCGPLEVFSAANFVVEKPLFNVFTIAEDKKPVTTINGLSVNPDYSLRDTPLPDLLVIPGGEGTKDIIENKRVMAQLEVWHQKAQHTLTVCSGARIAARAGWLKNRQFSTHHTVYEEISAMEPLATPCPDLRYTDNGRLLTSAGVSAGTDLSFYLLEKIAGTTTANKTAKYMEYVR